MADDDFRGRAEPLSKAGFDTAISVLDQINAPS